MDLGALVSSHRGQFFAGRSVGGMLAAFALGLAILGFGLAGAGKNPPLAVLLGLGFVGIGVFFVTRQLRAAGRRLDVFSDGLRYVDSGNMTEVGWHQVRGVRYRSIRVAGAFDHLGVVLSENIPGLPRA